MAILDLYSKRQAAARPAPTSEPEGIRARAGRLLGDALTLLRPTAYGYSRHGASRTKKSLLGWLSKAGSPDEDVTANLATLRERSRDLYMGTPLATGALETLVTNVVGSGLRLNVQVDADALGLSEDEAEEWGRRTEREFALWADSQHCDAARTCTFGQLQELACLTALMSGDVFALLPIVARPGSLYDLRVQLLEGDRVCDPPFAWDVDANIYAGVELGQYGDPIAYHVAKYHPGSQQSSTTTAATSNYVTIGNPLAPHLVQNEWQRIEVYGVASGRRNILHLLEQRRPEQRRGVPILAPVMEQLKQLGRYTDAELMATVVASFFTAFIKTSQAEGGSFNSPFGEEDLVDSNDANSVELGNGAVVSLAPGEDVTVANPGRPNTAFDGFVLAILRQVGSALQIPHELLVKHFTSSYSASRAALLEAWKMFRKRRAWMAVSFCQPVYEEWLAEAVAKGRVQAPGFFGDPAIRAAWSGAEWYGPSPGQIDPRAEVEAAVIRVNEGFSTRARETAELTGSDWTTLNRIRAREEGMRRDNGLIASTDANKGTVGAQVEAVMAIVERVMAWEITRETGIQIYLSIFGGERGAAEFVIPAPGAEPVPRKATPGAPAPAPQEQQP